MQIGMIGLGRMGANMARRLHKGGHNCVVYDRNDNAVKSLVAEGIQGVSSLNELVAKLHKPRAIWLMISTDAVDASLKELAPLLDGGDIIIDGGNSYYVDDMSRARRLSSSGIGYVDVGTSGGIWGAERGYCLMIGGSDLQFRYLEPIFRTLAPGIGDIPRTPDRPAERGTAELGFLHCGPSGAGHFVKMVHNGIEYGLMAAYAEGFAILRSADVGKRRQTAVGNAETTPLRVPANYAYDLDLAEIAELWRRGSVVSSWLLDLAATALTKDPKLEQFAGRVSDSGEGRWTVQAAIDQAVPAPVLTSALYARFSSRGEAEFEDKLLSALRNEFGGHLETANA